jgi:hypothetical protein
MKFQAKSIYHYRTYHQHIIGYYKHRQRLLSRRYDANKWLVSSISIDQRNGNGSMLASIYPWNRRWQ